MFDSFRKLKAIAVLLILLGGATRARATVATGTVGGLGSEWVRSIATVTLIDTARPATAAGNYDKATVLWAGGGGGPCSAAFKIRFYRPTYPGSPTLSLVAERGPFDAHQGFVTVALSPAVPLLPGDLIAVRELLVASCGSLALVTSGAGTKTVAFLLDNPNHSVTLCDGSPIFISEAMDAIATAGGTEVRSGIVTGAGSAHGAAGSNFRTAIQIVNPGTNAIGGRLVFHPIGHEGSASDPSIPYSVDGRRTASIADIVAAIGVSGLGSIDVIADASYPPLIVTRVFNDAGAAGTAGFTEPTVRPGDQFVIEEDEDASLVAPADPTASRMNIGVRSLAEGASISVALVDAVTGAFKKFFSKTYGPDFFDQRTARDFLGGTDVSPNDVVKIFVTSGRAIVYSVSVDNITNDTSLQLGTRTGF